MNTEILPLFFIGFERKGFSNKNFHIRPSEPSPSVFYNQWFGLFLLVSEFCFLKLIILFTDH